MKKFLTYSVVAATIAWSMGISAVLPAFAATPADGTIVKVNGVGSASGELYYISGGKRFLFANNLTFNTWFPAFTSAGKLTSNYTAANIVRISQADFEAIPVGGNVTVRPGTSLVKMSNSANVYVVAPGNKLCLVDTAAKTALYGASAAVGLIQSSFEGNYTVDASCALTATSKYPDGSLIKDSTGTYYISGGAKRAVSGDAFTANKFNAKFVHTVADASGYTTGAAITGYDSSIAAVISGTVVNTVTTNVSASLAADSPASGTLISADSSSNASQAGADLAHFVLTNGGSSAVTVNKITLSRIGVSSDDTLKYVYLFNGTQRLTDSGSVSTGIITFTDYSAGIVVIPAGGSVTLSVKADLAAGQSGKTVGVKLLGVNDASFAVSGNIQSVAQATDLASVYSTASTTVALTTDPISDFVVWGNTISVNNRDVLLKRLALRMIGSINYSNVSNFRLYVAGNLVATTANLDSNGYVTLVPTSPYTIKTGSAEMKVLADINGGASRQLSFSLRGAYDVDLVDSSYNVNTAMGGSSYWSGSTITVNSVTTNGVTVEKAGDSPASDVVAGGSGVLLARYKLTSYGEDVKIDTLRFTFNETSTTVQTLRNVSLFLNGNQIGSTATLNSQTSSPAYTEYNVNTTLAAGSTYTLEVKGDIYDNTGTNNIGADQKITVSMVAGSNNAQGKTSGSLTSVPATAKPAGVLTVKQGSLSVGKVSSYGTQTIVVPQTAYKIGSYVVTGNSSEAVNLTSLSLGVSALTSNMSDVYLVYNGKTSSKKATISGSGNIWSISEQIAAGGSMNVDVYASINSSASGSATTSLSVYGNTQTSGQSVNNWANGQTITTGNGSLNVTLVSDSTTNKKLAVAGALVPVAKVQFQAVNDSYTLNYMTVSSSAAGATGISQVIVKDGSTEVGKISSWSGTSNDLYFTSPISIPAGSSNSKTLTLYAVTSAVNSDNAGANIALGITSVNATAGSTGTSNQSVTINGKDVFVFRSIPTVTLSTGDTKLSGGSRQLARVTISADAAGKIAWQSLVFTVSTSGTYTLNNLALKDSSNNTIGSTTRTGNKATTTLSAEESFTGANTYILWGDVAGTINTGDSLTVSVASPSTSITTSTAASFVWSDVSNDNAHSLGSNDWFSDYLVQSLPTPSIGPSN